MPQRKRDDNEYLVAEPAGFPGVKIPLLSDEECRARGIEPGRLPPRETWTQDQRDAADRLIEILLPHVYLESMEVILAELERQPPDSTIPDAEMEKLAAQRGIALIDAGKWKQRHTEIYFPQSWVRQILETIAQGKISLCNPESERSRRRGRPRQGSASRGSRGRDRP